MSTAQSGPWIGVTGVIVMLWMTIATVVFAPWWGVLLYCVVWLVSLVFIIGWVRTRPRQSAYVPVAGFAAWLAISAAGAFWWGWGS